MFAMSLETWVSVSSMLGVGIALATTVMRSNGRTRTELKAEITGHRSEFKEDIAGLRGETKADIAGLRTEITGLRTELKDEITGLRTELKTDIAELRTDLKSDIARLDNRVYALAAGLKPVLEAAPTGEPRP